MDTFTFGLTLLVVGMGGTLLVLFLLTLVIRGLTALFPARETSENERGAPHD
jgi:Na+-transporting methylmalonyl-CoA/oxaloacetate decarboxylase gamma subunit